MQWPVLEEKGNRGCEGNFTNMNIRKEATVTEREKKFSPLIGQENSPRDPPYKKAILNRDSHTDCQPF